MKEETLLVEEIEVALTTNLLDNRLIINSNVGYKEDAFTETNFIGDFDIRYKINRSGRLRLKLTLTLTINIMCVMLLLHKVLVSYTAKTSLQENSLELLSRRLFKLKAKNKTSQEGIS